MTFDELKATIDTRDNELTERAAFAQGDLWADGAGWIGPNASAGTGPTTAFVQDEIKRSFLSQNILGEVIDRHAAGAAGLAPFITTDPAEEIDEDDPEKTLTELLATIDEDGYLVGGWLSSNGAAEAFENAVAGALWATGNDAIPARAPLRLYIPAVELAPDGTLPAIPFNESLDRVRVHAPNPKDAGVIRDADGQPILGWYSYTETNGDEETPMLELSVQRGTLDTLDLDLKGEIPGTDPLETLILQVTVDDATITSGAAQNLSGLLTISEVIRPSLITNAAISLQKLASLAWTMMGRNTVVAGFLERIIMGAMPPGKWVNDTGQEVQPTTPGAVFEPAEFKAGPGTATFLSGIANIDKDGNITGYSSPSVYDRAPVDPGTLIRTKDEARAGILQECSQVHALMGGDASASGESRVQALQDFSMSLDPSLNALREAANTILTAAVRLAAFFASDHPEYALVEVHAAPRKNLQVTDDDASSEADQAAVLERDRVFAERVKAAIEASKKIQTETGERVPWQILLVGNATNTAPAGFLSGAMSQTAQAPEEEP